MGLSASDMLVVGDVMWMVCGSKSAVLLLRVGCSIDYVW